MDDITYLSTALRSQYIAIHIGFVYPEAYIPMLIGVVRIIFCNQHWHWCSSRVTNNNATRFNRARNWRPKLCGMMLYHFMVFRSTNRDAPQVMSDHPSPPPSSSSYAASVSPSVSSSSTSSSSSSSSCSGPQQMEVLPGPAPQSWLPHLHTRSQQEHLALLEIPEQ